MNKTHRNILDSLEGTSSIYTHICSRHRVEIITSISHFLLSQSGTRLHYSFFLMSASEVESEGLGKKNLWCPWKFGFKRMQHPSSILPWWLCTVIHIKTLPVCAEKCFAHPSKWKCISITMALFFCRVPSVFAILFIWPVFFGSSWPLDQRGTFPLEELN